MTTSQLLRVTMQLAKYVTPASSCFRLLWGFFLADELHMMCLYAL